MMPMDECNLTFVNVGYGEAVVLRCPAPERPGGWFVMVIDGGSGEAEEYADRASGRLTLAEYLTAAGVDHIDCMVATHIHEDHVCGLLPAAERWRPAELWQTLPPAFYREAMHLLDTSPAKTASQSKFLRALNDYQRLCGLVEAGGGAIRRFSAGDSGVLCSGLRYQVLAPGAERAGALERGCRELFAEWESRTFLEKLSALDARMNNYSLILRLEYRGTRILLPGDTNRAGYGDIAPGQLRAELFKVGHHGQKDGASPELLAAVRPEMVVCCASSDRRYESAHPDTMAMIEKAGGAVYFSDCPRIGDPSRGPAPHQALTFTAREGGELTARYVERV